jgi:hypothetical protein
MFNSSKSFSFIPADNWENYSKDNSLIFAKPLNSSSEYYRENIQIIEYPANGMTLDDLWESFVVKDFPNAFENFEFIRMWDSSVNGKKAKWIEFKNTANNLTYKNLVYMLVENDIMYYLICSATVTGYEQTIKEFRQMINTFEIE